MDTRIQNCTKPNLNLGYTELNLSAVESKMLLLHGIVHARRLVVCLALPCLRILLAGLGFRG